jgi:hypothetical protein
MKKTNKNHKNNKNNKKVENFRWTDGGDFGPREEWKEEAKGKGSLNPFEPSSPLFFFFLFYPFHSSLGPKSPPSVQR